MALVRKGGHESGPIRLHVPPLALEVSDEGADLGFEGHGRDLCPVERREDRFREA
jgi:hypothetical protein